MTPDFVIEMLTKALQLSLLVASPMLLFGLVIGLIISIFQSVTQIQEMTLTYIPKIIGVILAVMLFAPWMMDKMMSYTIMLFSSLPGYIGK